MRRFDRQVLLIGALFAVANLLGFAAYRLVFLGVFETLPSSAEIVQACLSGARVDLALIGCEFSLFCLLAQAPWLAQPLFWVAYWWTAGFLHFFACSAAYWFFRERQEHFGEILLRYATRIEEPLLAVKEFLAFHPWLVLLLLAGSAIYWWAGVRTGVWLAARMRPAPVRWRERAWLLVFTVGALSLTVDMVPRKWNVSPSGWVVRGVYAAEYATFDHFGLNQAVINPFYDLFRVQVVAALQPAPPDRWTKEEAVRRCLSALKRSPINEPYPLLTELTAIHHTNIRNVVVLQIESLSTGLLETASHGETVMPFLRECASRGLYFPNIIQAASQTVGSVFGVATGLPKENVEARVRRFADWELNGYYATLPRILSGKQYQHFAFHGGRTRLTDFGAFMGNQGFQNIAYRELSGELEKRKYKGQLGDAQGLLDGPFLEACARIILERREHYTAHILTTTSHPPCRPPSFFESRQTDDTLRTFQYVDVAIRRFMEILEKEDREFHQTLFVLTGDHARPVKLGGLVDALRVPLILFSPELSARGLVGQRKEWGSQLDILPTVLDLTGGTHVYAGIGRSLVRPRPEWAGLSTRSGETLYFRGSYVLIDRRLEGRSRLHVFRPDEPVSGDARSDYTGIQEEMALESLAIQETVRHLGRSRRIIPMSVAR